MQARTRIGALALLMVVAGAACIRAGADHTVIDVTATDHAYELSGSQTYKAGRVTLAVANDGDEDHMAAALKIADGVTAQEVRDALAANDQATFFSSISFAGGVSGVRPGEQQVTEQILDAGEYLLICFIPAADGAPHVAKGMLATFTVEPNDAGETTPVGSKGTLGVEDFTFDLAAATDGPGTFKVGNAGTEPHEINLLALDEDVSVPEAIAAVHAGPDDRPFSYAAGLAPIEPGADAWVQLDLEPGRYLAICFVPSAETGRAHFELGMTEELIIS